MPTFATDNCTPRLISVDDSNGCTLTRASIRAFTKEDFADQAMKEVGMDRIIAQTKEARMTGVQERALTDLFLSRMVGLKTSTLPGNESIIAPYSLVPRRHTVNASYFSVVAGAAHPTPGADGIPLSAWNITVNTGYSEWKSPLKNIEKYFLPGRFLVIETIDAGTNVARSLQYKILRSVNANSGSTELAKVTLEPNYSTTGWASLSGGDKAIYQPTRGSIMLLANSVSDYESWAHQEGATNNLGLIEYWEQTIRETHSYNDAYLEALKAPLTSEFFKKFRTLDLVRQRKEQELQAEKAFWNTVMFGQRITEKQTVEGYQDLPQVLDPGANGCLLEYKSNTEGVRTQLNNCGRVSDRAGAALDLDVIFESCYNLKRNREIESGSIDVIDAMTDRHTSNRVRDLMTKYYKSKYSTDLTMYMQPGKKITFNGATVFEYNLYDLPDQGMQLAVFTDKYFDDRISAFHTDIKSRARTFQMIDWSDVMVGVKRTSSVARKTNEADNLYNTVIKVNANHYQLRSKTIEVRVGDGNRSAAIENFSDACPTLTVSGCTVGA